MLKKLSVFLMLIILMLQGCTFPHSHPIEDTQNILIAGFDIVDNEIQLTVLVDSIIQTGESGNEQIEYKLYSATDKTVLGAKRKIYELSEKLVSFYHTRYILFGEQASKLGVDRILNFFAEDYETNFLHLLVIAKGITAKEYLEIENSGQKKIPDILNALFKESFHTGYSQKITLLNYSLMRETPWKSVYIPTVLLCKDPIQHQKTDSQNQNSQNSSKQSSTLSLLTGFGVFDEDKLTGFIDGDMARAMLFVINEIKDITITVVDNKGENVVLDVTESKAEIKPHYNKNLSASIEITVKSNLVDYQESEDVLDPTYIEYLEQQQNEYIKNQIEQMMAYLQSMQTDVIGMGDAFYRHDPKKWKDYEDKWKDVFADIDVKVKAISNIEYSYSMTNAIDN